jgi:hypothetical protein
MNITPTTKHLEALNTVIDFVDSSSELYKKLEDIRDFLFPEKTFMVKCKVKVEAEHIAKVTARTQKEAEELVENKATGDIFFNTQQLGVNRDDIGGKYDITILP